MSFTASPSERAPLLESRRNTDANKNDASATTTITNHVHAGTHVLGDDHTTATTSHEPDSPTDHGLIDAERAAQFSGDAAARKQLPYIFPSIAIGVFLCAADQTIIVSSYGRIGSDLHALNQTSWIATSYLLSQTSFQPLFGRLSDIFGRKPCLLFAFAAFGLGGLLCGLAQTIEQLIAARVVQGIGGGGMAVVVTVLFSDIVPLQQRGLWQGVLNMVYAAGAAGAAPLGGFCADVIGWRWTFLGQAPLSLLGFVSVAVVLKLPRRDDDNEEDWRAKLRRVDFLGAAVLVCAVFALLYGMDRGSNKSWLLPESYASLAASALFFISFVYIELRVATEPVAPSHIIFHPSMSASYACYFFSSASFLALTYYLPLYFQAVNDVSATGAGIRLLPAVLGGVTGSVAAGFYMNRTGKYRDLTIIAYVLFALSIPPIFLFSGFLADNLPGIITGMTLNGLAEGTGVTTLLISLIANASPADQAVATACSYLFRSLGSTVGVALSSTVLQQVLRSTLRRDLGSGDDAAEIERNVRESLDYLRQLDPEVQAVVRRAYALAVRHSYVVMFVLALASSASTFFIKEKRLSK